MQRKKGKEKRERKSTPLRAPPRRFQSDTNLYGGEILTSLGRVLFFLALPETSILKLECSPVSPAGSPPRKALTRVNTPPSYSYQRTVGSSLYIYMYVCIRALLVKFPSNKLLPRAEKRLLFRISLI